MQFNMTHQQVKQPLYPQLEAQTLSMIDPFVKYGLKKMQATSYKLHKKKSLP